MLAFVADASMTLSWCFRDERTPETLALLEKLNTDRMLVPTLWWLEVTNSVLQAQRRGRIQEAELPDLLSMLAALPLEIDTETHSRAAREIFQLARTHQLTTYDAAYLELAQRRGLPLATRDQMLRAQAQALGIPVLPA